MAAEAVTVTAVVPNNTSASKGHVGVLSVLQATYILLVLQVLFLALKEAYNIRLYAIEEYGLVIHEFDPYFNFRATEYLWDHGWQAFKTWFDYLVWYPLGRPVGTTIYPGMQVTSVFIKRYILPEWSLNDICCFVPAWFGVLATTSTALLCYECMQGESVTVFEDIPIVGWVYRKLVAPLLKRLLNAVIVATGSAWGFDSTSKGALECAVFTACAMSIVPAHLMRSVGGGYDNESVATFAMVSTFATWVRCLRAGQSSIAIVLWAALAGLAYFYMVAAWGGYVFCINLIATHAAVLVLANRFSFSTYIAYTTFYIVGTMLAVQVPVVGWTPLKSLEQMGPLLVFFGYQGLQLSVFAIKKYNVDNKMDQAKVFVMIFGVAGLVVATIASLLWGSGYFGPISSRVRGLFVKHTKTGNPLVDSVAEHQAASAGAYFQYLAEICYAAPLGLALVLLKWNNQSSFLLVYSSAAYFFSHKMVRLILLTAPIASVCTGIALGQAWKVFVAGPFFGCNNVPTIAGVMSTSAEEETPPVVVASKTSAKKKKKDEGDDKVVTATMSSSSAPKETWFSRITMFAIGIALVYKMFPFATQFHEKSHSIAKHLSHPSIIQKGNLRDSGKSVTIDDYREAYFWLRDNTPADSRIMAWWDYGYQITAMANRTTIADGNTWNHEHIALLGRALTSPEREGHRIARHLADYVLLWTGGGGDDLAKSPHLARIANSVYRHMCPGDPTCRSFGITQQGAPTPKMAASLLYKLHSHNLVNGVQADRNRFKEVYKSKYGKVRIFKIISVSKESKEWVADPANRKCDAPGSWYCPGQYPPGLQKILKEKQDFRQLEDFNVDREHDAEYTKKYMENLNNPEKAKRAAQEEQANEMKKKLRKLSNEEIKQLNSKWEDTQMTTLMWQLVSSNNLQSLRDYLVESPALAHVRSSDGRGPMWWAHEYGRSNMIKLLKKLGVSESLQDENGITPLDLAE